MSSQSKYLCFEGTTSLHNIFSSCLIVYMIGLPITIITVILQIMKFDLLCRSLTERGENSRKSGLKRDSTIAAIFPW